MRKALITLLIIFVLLGSFVWYTFNSTGFFREINNSESYEVIAEFALKGAEDLTIDYTKGFMIISQDDRAGRRDGNPSQGHLYYLDLQADVFKPVQLTGDLKISFYPHGISLYRLDSNRVQLLVVNHAKGHTIERFDLYGSDSLVHRFTYTDELMVSPNDVIALDSSSFYFTNDHGYTSKLGLLAENYLGLAVSDVVFYDGIYQKVAEGIAYANGINVSTDRSKLLVASPRSFSLLSYTILPDGDLELDQQLDVGSGIDNIELDEDGNLWMGSHPNLLAFTSYAAGKSEVAPSEIIKVSGKQVESLYENDGTTVAASSVVAPYKDLLFVGTVMDDKMVVLKKKGNDFR